MSDQKQLTPKERLLLDAAEALFLRLGIRRVTVEEVCRKSGVSKMTFYKYFSNKYDLARRVVLRMFDDVGRRKWEILRAEKSFHWKAEQLIQMEIDIARDMSEDFMEDFFKSPELAEITVPMMEEAYRDLDNLYRTAQANGEIRDDVDIELIMYMTRNMYAVMMDRSISSHYENMHEFTRQITKLFFFGVLSREDRES